MEISRLWAGMLTRYLGEAETDDSITLTINVGGVDLLNHTFPDTLQRDQEKGQANLYEVNVEGSNIVPEELAPSSIRVGILGKDAWRPEHFMVWGKRVSFIGGTEIIPLALETDITTQLSTEPESSGEAVQDIPLTPVDRGNRNMQINRLFMLLTTAGIPIVDTGSGTNDPLEIQIVNEGQLVVLSEIEDTTQDDLEARGANFYSAPVIAPFTKNSLDDRSITLRIKGRDNWEPASFFLFGLDDAAGRPEFLVPLVHLPEWPHGVMEADPTTGVASVTLSLAPEKAGEFVDPGGEFLETLNSIATGQKKIVELLERLIAK